jgi:hypothetical protein
LGYLGRCEVSLAEKRVALAAVANGAPYLPAGRAKYRIGAEIVHVRFCSAYSGAPSKFKFNINPNTLSATYELWICGSAAIYYLMPISFVKGIYENPFTYPDRQHPGIKVVSVDAHTHSVTFASGGTSASLRTFLRERL